MKDQLHSYRVTVVALSKDSVAEAAAHKQRDQVKITLLADPQLKVIRQYGLEHHKSLGSNTGSLKLFGLPVSFTASFKTMAIPTSILIDENGIIQWIDQSDDYRLRSNPDVIFDAIKRAFPT